MHPALHPPARPTVTRADRPDRAPARPRTGRLALPFGSIGVAYQDRQVLQVCLAPPATWSGSPLPLWLDTEFLAYLRDPGHRIALTPSVSGTAFQQRVWAAIATIPPGCTLTYGALAQRLGSSPRAVGNACRANPVPLLVPCHRVVAARGLGGFAGDRGGRLLAIKRWLLAHEGVAGHAVTPAPWLTGAPPP